MNPRQRNRIAAILGIVFLGLLLYFVIQILTPSSVVGQFLDHLINIPIVSKSSAPVSSATPTSTSTATSSPTSTSTPGPTPTGLPSGPDEWTQLAGNPQHTGYVSEDIPTPWRVKWIWNGPIGGGDAGPSPDHLVLPKDVQPVSGDGRLYIGNSNGTLLAISEATGQQVWSADLGNSISNTAAYDSQNRSVYVDTTDGHLYRVESTNGHVIHSIQLNAQIMMAPLLVGNTVYIGSLDGYLYALNKDSLEQRWSYNAQSALVATPAYTPNHGGLIILEVEDKSIQAIHADNGTRFWRVTVYGDVNPDNNLAFPDAFPVISNANDVVIVRSYLLWDKLWQPTGGAPTTVSAIRDYLTQNPTLQSFFVLNLTDGSSRFVAPVLVGGISDPAVFQSVPPQAVIDRLPNGSEVAYLLWRNGQACIRGSCDGREDTTLGEMDLTTGNIRFVQERKNQGVMRLPGDEQSPLSMAGDMLFYAHWMLMGDLQITDRSPNLGGSYTDPIRTSQLTPALNTLAAGSCGGRSNHYCPETMYPPCDTFAVNPGFYTYYSSSCVYNQFWSTPVRSAVITNGTIYWHSVDGAIMAIESTNP